MQQAWTVTAFRETRGASRRFRSAERGNVTSPGLLIEREGSVAPARLSVKACPVKSTLPALRSREERGRRHGYVQGCGIVQQFKEFRTRVVLLGLAVLLLVFGFSKILVLPVAT